MANPIRVFRAFADQTTSIAATNTSGNIQMLPANTQLTQRSEYNCQVYNDGTAVIFVTFGETSGTTALTPSGSTKGSIPIASKATINFRLDPRKIWAAAITGTNGTVYFTPGEGA